MRCPICGLDLGCTCVKPGDTITVDAEVYTEEPMIFSRADDVMAYEATTGPLAGMSILIERWNGKGFNSVRMLGGRATELGKFLLSYLQEQPDVNHTYSMFGGDPPTGKAKAIVHAYGKKAAIENVIVKGLTAWHAQAMSPPG